MCGCVWCDCVDFCVVVLFVDDCCVDCFLVCWFGVCCWCWYCGVVGWDVVGCCFWDFCVWIVV